MLAIFPSVCPCLAKLNELTTCTCKVRVEMVKDQDAMACHTFPNLRSIFSADLGRKVISLMRTAIAGQPRSSSSSSNSSPDCLHVYTCMLPYMYCYKRVYV